MGLQDAVYKLEEGGGAVWIRRVVIVLSFIALATWIDVNQFRGFDSPEAMDAAQVARQISRGEGFTTHFIRPIALAQMRDHHAPKTMDDDPAAPTTVSPEKRDFSTLPDTYNAPLYPLTLAVLFKVTRLTFEADPNSRTYAPEMVVVVFNQLCFALTAGLLFLLARALFDLRVAWTTAVVFLLGNLAWKFTLSGTAVLLTVLFLVAAFYAFHRALLAEEAEEGGQGLVWGWVVGSGVAIALAALCDYAVLWLLPLYGAAVGFAFRARWGLVLTVVGIWLLLLVPWAVRNTTLIGDPLGGHTLRLLEEGGTFPGSTLARSYRPTEVKPAIFFQEVRVKLVRGLRYHFDEGFRLLGSSVATALFFGAFLHIFRRRRAQILRYFALAGLIILAGGASIIHPTPEPARMANYLFLLWPLTVIFGVAFFYILLDRIEVPLSQIRYGIIGLFIALNAMPLLLVLAPPGGGVFNYPPYFPPILSFIGHWYEKDEVIVSDLPWGVAWYTDRPSLWLPVTLKEYTEVNDYVSPLTAILLTPESRNSPACLEIDKGQWKEWAQTLYGHSIPNGLGLATATFLPPDKNDYLLISDRDRWTPPKPAATEP